MPPRRTATPAHKPARTLPKLLNGDEVPHSHRYLYNPLLPSGYRNPRVYNTPRKCFRSFFEGPLHNQTWNFWTMVFVVINTTIGAIHFLAFSGIHDKPDHDFQHPSPLMPILFLWMASATHSFFSCGFHAFGIISHAYFRRWQNYDFAAMFAVGPFVVFGAAYWPFYRNSLAWNSVVALTMTMCAAAQIRTLGSSKQAGLSKSLRAAVIGICAMVALCPILGTGLCAAFSPRHEKTMALLRLYPKIATAFSYLHWIVLFEVAFLALGAILYVKHWPEASLACRSPAADSASDAIPAREESASPAPRATREESASPAPRRNRPAAVGRGSSRGRTAASSAIAMASGTSATKTSAKTPSLRHDLSLTAYHSHLLLHWGHVLSNVCFWMAVGVIGRVVLVVPRSPFEGPCEVFL